jgi:predicted RNA-binding protein with PUA-like domain
MRHWLLKTEPKSYSIDDLKKQEVGTWDGVRNYAARNNLRSMQKGDLVFIYHSSAAVIGIAGIGTVAKEAYPDPSQFKKTGTHYDPKATVQKPIWSAVDIKFKKKFANLLTLAEIKNDPKLRDMVVVQPGSRLSVQPVTPEQFEHIVHTHK